MPICLAIVLKVTKCKIKFFFIIKPHCHYGRWLTWSVSFCGKLLKKNKRTNKNGDNTIQQIRYLWNKLKINRHCRRDIFSDKIRQIKYICCFHKVQRLLQCFPSYCWKTNREEKYWKRNISSYPNRSIFIKMSSSLYIIMQLFRNNNKYKNYMKFMLPFVVANCLLSFFIIFFIKFA